MSSPDELASPIEELDPVITVPASVLEGLLKRAEALEVAAQGLRQQLGGLMLSGESVADGDQPTVPTESSDQSLPASLAKPQQVHGSVRLFSQLEIDSTKPFSEVESQMRARAELLDSIRNKTAPYSSAFMNEMFLTRSNNRRKNTYIATMPFI